MSNFSPEFLAQCAAKAAKESGVDMNIFVNGGMVEIVPLNFGKKPEETTQTITHAGEETPEAETNENH